MFVSSSRRKLKVERIVFFGAYASRNDIPEAMRASLVQFTRINWGLAAQMFASLFDPHAGGDELQKYTRMQRKAATAEAAGGTLPSTALRVIVAYDGAATCAAYLLASAAWED